MSHIKNLKCLLCGKEYGPEEVLYVCRDHDAEGVLDVQYDYDLIASRFSRSDLEERREESLWRYKRLLPVKPDAFEPPIKVGWTPLYRASRLAEALGLRDLWVKDESREPTGSLKDRASLIAIVKALELQAKVISTASTGNAGAALSGLCASVGMANVIFVPASAPEAKVAQLLVYGSFVLTVEGTYDDAFELCLEAAKVYGWYIRSTGYNPYMTEGKKTVVYEIYEQLGWEEPDVILVPVGDGCILGGVHKGLKDLSSLGWIKKTPRLIGVQASGSAALYHAWKEGLDPCRMKPIEVCTVADSLASGLPRDRIKAMRAVRETGGAFLTVTDEEILEAIPVLARGCGIFAEPAGASSFAGLVKAVKTRRVSPEEKIVILVTGTGLKDIPSAMRVVGKPKRIHASLNALEAALGENKLLWRT